MERMDSRRNRLNIFLYLTILMCLMFGALFVGIFFVYRYDNWQYASLSIPEWGIAGYLIIVASAVFIMAIGIGMYASVRASHCLTFVFLVMSAVPIVLFFIASAYSFQSGAVMRRLGNGNLTRNLVDNLNNYGMNISKIPYTVAIDSIQHSLSCCGWVSKKDFEGTPFVINNGIFPNSCCEFAPCSLGNSYERGCIIGYVKAVGRTHLVIAIAALIGCMFCISGFLVLMLLYCAFAPWNFAYNYMNE